MQFNVSSTNIDQYPLVYNWTNPTVSFVETGLAAGTEWNVTFNGTLLTSVSDTIAFSIVDAVYSTYNYTVGNVTGYDLSALSGQVSYSGMSSTIPVTYTAIVPPPPPPPVITNYSVNFTESGLPAGTTWSTVLNGTTHSSTTNLISFEMPNGTYSYSVGTVSGYTPDISSGSVTVDGSDASVQISFTQVTYTVSFNTVGLPSGTTWYVNISGGSSHSSSGSSITLQLPNGTYSYTVSNVTGFNLSNPAGTVTVSGGNPNPITVTYTVQNSTSPDAIPNGNPGINPWIYVLIGVIVSSAVTAVVLEVYHRRK